MTNRSDEPTDNGTQTNEKQVTVFTDYRNHRAQKTLDSQDNTLRAFAAFLESDADLRNDPAAWRDITWSHVKGFVEQMVQDGYALATVNGALAHIRIYAKLAMRAGVLDTQELVLIRAIQGYDRVEAQQVDAERTAAGIATRISHKKADFNILTDAQCEALHHLFYTKAPQGRRDAVLVLLLLDLGLRVSEAVSLKASDFDPATGILTVRRPQMTTTFTLKHEMLATMRAYFEYDKPQDTLLRGSQKNGWLLTGSMSARAIQARVARWGATLGIPNLSPYDLRHTCAARLVAVMPIKLLMDFFGWTSPVMAARYIEG